MLPRLITIPISHYCEKARWALDRAGVAYVEERHVQGPSIVFARRAGGGWTTPVLVTAEGSLGESEAIVVWADRHVAPERRLLPEDPRERADVLAVARGFDAGLGPAGRRLIYAHMLRARDQMLAVNNQGVPHIEDRALRLLFPLLGSLIRVRLGMGREPSPEDERAVEAAFDTAAERLADGRRYLCGERFSAADLTFAALAAPVLAPERYGIRLPPPEELPAGAAALVRRFRAHPAGRFALRVIDEERPPPQR